MKRMLVGMAVGLGALSAARGELLFQWQEAVTVNGSNCVVHGRQVRGADGAARTEYTFADGARLPASFEAANQKNWNVAPARQAGAAVQAAARPIPEPVSVRERLVQACAHVSLGALDLAPVLREDALRNADGPRGRRIGVFRDVPRPLTIDGHSLWLPTSEGGQVTTIEFFSPAAEGLRIAIDEARIPDGARFMVYASDRPSERRGPYTRADVARDGARFWTESIWNQRATLELALPPGASEQDVSFALRRIVHTYLRPGGQPRDAAQFCEMDSTCQPAWASQAAAVAGLGTVGDDGFLFCTGCLIADNDPFDKDTYFMTAHHCVGSATAAGTLEFYWFYQTANCNGAPPDVLDVPRTGGGADYLAGASDRTANDFSFLRLRLPPAPGTFLAAWSGAAPSTTSTVTCLHHPNGDYKRISFGNLANAGTDPNYWNVRWFSGVTEPGSSGSPLFNPAHEFIGQLWGGQSYCTRPNGVDDFGRFDRTLPVVRPWLQPAAPLRLLSFPTRRDFDGDGRADLNTFQRADSRWSIARSSLGFQTYQYGPVGAIPLIADFDGDHKADAAVFYPPAGQWTWYSSASNRGNALQFGYSASIPVPADYDGDGRTDLAVFDPPSGAWYIIRSTLGYYVLQFGYSASLPVPADYDGDGKADIAVFDPPSGRWYIIRSGGGYSVVQFGYSAVAPVPADYDGDGKADITVFDSAAGTWYSIGTSAGYRVRTFGGGGSIPVPGDYDGDTKADFASYKLAIGRWMILRSSNNTTNTTTFGWSGAPPIGVAP